MAVIRNEPRRVEPTERRIVEVTADGQIVSSEPLDATTPVLQPAAPLQPAMVQPPPQVIRVKRGGTGALMILSLVLVIALAGLGFYVYQTRGDTAAKQQAELEQQQAELQLQQQRTVAEEKLEQLGRAADDLGAQVRDTQRDLGIPATPPPAATTPATTAPVQPAAPVAPAPQ